MIALALAVAFVAVCEVVAWLRYPGGGTSFVTQAEVERVERECRRDAGGG